MFFMQRRKCLEAAGSFPQSDITNAQTGRVILFISICVSLRFHKYIISNPAETDDGF